MFPPPQQPVRFRYFANKWVDPLIGIAMGVAAFALMERRENRHPDHTLYALFMNSNSKSNK